MLWTIFLVLLVLWLVGFIGFHVVAWYIHVLLIIALVVLVIQLIGGRRAILTGFLFLSRPGCRDDWGSISLNQVPVPSQAKETDHEQRPSNRQSGTGSRAREAECRGDPG